MSVSAPALRGGCWRSSLDDRMVLIFASKESFCDVGRGPTAVFYAQKLSEHTPSLRDSIVQGLEGALAYRDRVGVG